MLRDLLADSTRFIVKRNAQFFDVFAEICNPVRESMQLFAEFLGRRVAEIRLSISHSLGQNSIPMVRARPPGRSTSPLARPAVAPYQPKYALSDSERKTETEMKRAKILELVRIGINTVIKTNRTHWQLVKQTSTNRVAHVVQPNI